tara:strand:- start:316 stop:477 length:162 start_codon:yes stop_codon:yes gene_type:complete
MAKSYFILKQVFNNQNILKTKKVGRKYVHFVFPNGLPVKISHNNYKLWNGGVL